MKKNKELILRLYKAFSERNIEELERICAPDIVWRQNPGFPGGGINLGHQEIIKNVYEANSKRWKYFTFKRTNISATENTVLVEGVYEVQGPKSQKKISAQTAHVFKIENGLVVSFQQYTDSKSLWDNYAMEE